MIDQINLFLVELTTLKNWIRYKIRNEHMNDLRQGKQYFRLGKSSTIFEDQNKLDHHSRPKVSNIKLYTKF